MPTPDYRSTIRPLTKAEGTGYLIEFPDLPGCLSDGETIEEALANGMEAKSAWIKAMRKAGRPIPPPGTKSAARFNEGKAIDAVVRTIENRDQIVRQNNGWSPEELNDTNEQERVDYVCTIGTESYAFEHTGIEPFPDQIKLEVSNKKLFAPIEQRFRNRNDQELWDLHVPVNASAGLSQAQAQSVQRAIIAWIDENATRFPVAWIYSKYRNPHLGETIPDVAFRISLHRWHRVGGGLYGKFRIKYSVANDLESRRAERPRMTCKSKFPKLACWKKKGLELS